MSNPTDARTVALEFHRLVFGKVINGKVAQTVVQAKRLLDEGYDVEDILLLVEYIVRYTSVNMYSLGYVSAVIRDLLPKAKVKQEYEKQLKLQEEMAEKARELEVQNDAERNRSKARDFGIQSRGRKKHNFDLLN